MKSHYETVICPDCKSIELLEVTHSFPHWTYFGYCSKCNYQIIESEWNSTGHIWNDDMMNVLWKMKDSSIDIVITDPPYGTRKSTKDTDFSWDEEEHFKNHIQKWLLECLRVSKHTVIWHCAGRMLPYFFENPYLRKTFWRFHVWEKPPGSQYNGASHNNVWYNIEPILIFSKDFKKTASNFDRDVSFAYDNLSYPTVAKKQYGHPTTKPLGEIIDLVLHYSLPNDTILDPFAGSFTLAEACIKTNRKYVCVEMSEEYHQIGIKRISNLNIDIDMFLQIEAPNKKFRKDENQQSLL